MYHFQLSTSNSPLGDSMVYSASCTSISAELKYKRTTCCISQSPGKIVNCGVYEFRVRPAGYAWEIVRWGECAHLEEVGYSKHAFGGGTDSG